MILGIYGAGGLGREVLELARIINEKVKKWDDVIFVVDNNKNEDGINKEVNGIPVYSYEEAIKEYSDSLEVTVGIGEPMVRKRVFNQLEDSGIRLATLIHPDVYIPNSTTIGKGVTIQANSFVSCNVSIGDYVFIQPHVNIGHDDVLKKGCIVSGFCNLAGHVTIGEFTYLGISSVFKEGVEIGDYSIIGMGSVVHKDIPSEMIAMGNPARPMKQNEDRQVFK